MTTQKQNARSDPARTRQVVALILLGLVLVFCIILFFNEVVLSLKNYSPATGIVGSPWVGLSNYEKLFSFRAFERGIVNSVVFNILFSAIGFLLICSAGALLMFLPRRNLIRETLALLILLPVFLPAEVYAGWWLNLLGSRPFTDPSVMRTLHPLLCAIKYVGVPIWVVHVLDNQWVNKDGLLPIKIGTLSVLAVLALAGTGFFSLTHLFYNPFTYETMDMMDTIAFRSGLIGADYGVGAAQSVIQMGVCAVSMALLFVPIKLLIKNIFKTRDVHAENESFSSKVLPVITALVLFGVIYFIPSFIHGIDLSSYNTMSFLPIAGYLVASAIAAGIAVGLATIISNFAVRSGRARLIGGAMLALITVLTTRPFTFSSYLFMRGLGVLDSLAAVTLAGCFSVGAVWALSLLRQNIAVGQSPGITFSTLFGLFLLLTALIYMNSTPAFIYLFRADLSPIMKYRELMLKAQELSTAAGLSLFGLIVSLPPLLLFSIASLILPKHAQVLVVAAGMKN